MIEPQKNRWRLENKLRPALTKEKSCTTNPSRNEDIYESAYPTNKRKEIREGKRREPSICSSSNSSSTYSYESRSESSMDYMLQLIRGLEDKIYSMEWEAPYRS